MRYFTINLHFVSKPFNYCHCSNFEHLIQYICWCVNTFADTPANKLITTVTLNLNFAAARKHLMAALHYM